MTGARTSEPRRLSGWLLIGVLTLPIIFTWFTLRRGYSIDLRRGAFLHLGLAVLVGIAR